MSRPTESTIAILLRSVAYGDADRIVTLLTQSHGKVSLLARSARRSTKRFPSGSLEPFGMIDVEIVVGHAEVGRLGSARLSRAFPRLLGSLDRITTAGEAIELVRDIIPAREPDERLLRAIEMLFALLDQEPCEPRDVALAFELRMLALLGLAPRLDACGRCGARAEDRSALFDPALGSIVCRSCGGGPILLSAKSRARMIAALADRWFEIEPWTERERSEAATSLGAFIQRHLGRAHRSERREQRGT